MKLQETTTTPPTHSSHHASASNSSIALPLRLTVDDEVSLCHLHPNRNHFALPPRVFSCVAFIHNHTPNTSMLAPHYVKEVFVGYSCMQKGYRVYFSDQRKYIDLAGVIFFESTHYYSSTSSSSTPPLAPSPSPIPTSSSLSSPMIRFHLPIPMDPALLLPLSPPSSPIPQLNSFALPQLMLPTTFPVLISNTTNFSRLMHKMTQ